MPAIRPDLPPRSTPACVHFHTALSVEFIQALSRGEVCRLTRGARTQTWGGAGKEGFKGNLEELS